VLTGLCRHAPPRFNGIMPIPGAGHLLMMYWAFVQQWQGYVHSSVFACVC